MHIMLYNILVKYYACDISDQNNKIGRFMF